MQMNKEQAVWELRNIVRGARIKTTLPWQRHQMSIVKKAEEEDLDTFLSWPVIEGTMVVNDCPYVRKEFEQLEERYAKAAIDPGFCNPRPFISPNTGLSANYVHQAFHAQAFEAVCNYQLSDFDNIIEFGGGYGVFAVVASRLGFIGEYIIYDLPELCVLQQYYLSKVGVAADSRRIDQWSHVGRPIELQGKTLLVGLYSLSETPRLYREAFVCFSNPDSMFFAYNGVFEEEDCEKEFSRIIDQYPHFEWVKFPAGSPDGTYLIGDK